MPDSPTFAQLRNDLRTSGYAATDDFLDHRSIQTLAAECCSANAAGLLQPASVGRGDARALRSEIRGDRTRWLDPAEPTVAQTAYWSRIETLRVSLNHDLLLGLEEIEAHFALYPPGARYARHRDRFRDDDARVVSSVLYLNDDWTPQHGGALRLFLPDGAEIPHVDIYPKAGRLVLFLSAEFEHEVLPATRERLSIAGWFRRRS